MKRKNGIFEEIKSFNACFVQFGALTLSAQDFSNRDALKVVMQLP
ncbi:MAG: hypothetical protein R2836_07235 [Chitinophagales bacterium]